LFFWDSEGVVTGPGWGCPLRGGARAGWCIWYEFFACFFLMQRYISVPM